MDPCLCDLDGFGPEDEEDTTGKDLEEIVGKKCIVKTTWEGDSLFSRLFNNFNISDRATDVAGTIKEFRIVIDTERNENDLLELNPENLEALTPILTFFITYDESINGQLGHWYLDDEVIYL
jgi:hypothetical protein